MGESLADLDLLPSGVGCLLAVRRGYPPDCLCTTLDKTLPDQYRRPPNVLIELADLGFDFPNRGRCMTALEQ